MTEPAPVETGYARFTVRQKLTLMVNRYEIIELDEAGNELGLLAFAEQKRMQFKEEVTFFTDAARTEPIFTFKARKRIDLASSYDITDAAGRPIGWFKKEFGASLLNSTWTLGSSDGFACVGRERSAAIALIRRIRDFIPIIGEFGSPWLFHFDFRSGDGSVVMSSVRKPGIKDRYVIDLPAQPNGWRLDWRVAAAMAVALDALQAR